MKDTWGHGNKSRLRNYLSQRKKLTPRQERRLLRKFRNWNKKGTAGHEL